MNKRTLVTVFIAGSMLATPLFASNFFHKLMSGKQSVQSASQLHAKSQVKHDRQDYTDFSGNWAGTCSINEYELPMFISLENSDDEITMDGETFKIGPLHTRSSAEESTTTFDHTSLEWSNDMSTLKFKSLYIEKEQSSYPNNQSKPIVTMFGEFTFALDNDELTLSGQSTAHIDMAQMGELTTINCVLNKDTVKN